jgi:hypothetical protein
VKNSKRYVISLASGLFLAGLATLSVFFRLEGVASVCVAGIMTILTTYIWGETKRPSNPGNNEKE